LEKNHQPHMFDLRSNDPILIEIKIEIKRRLQRRQRVSSVVVGISGYRCRARKMPSNAPGRGSPRGGRSRHSVPLCPEAKGALHLRSVEDRTIGRGTYEDVWQMEINEIWTRSPELLSWLHPQPRQGAFLSMTTAPLGGRWVGLLHDARATAGRLIRN
jgi:hypothetical protein